MPIITDPNIITRDEIVYNPKPNPNVEPSPAEGIEIISIYSREVPFTAGI